MYCIHCGKELSEGERFCCGCGTPNTAVSAPAVKKEMPDATLILVFGIISVAVGMVVGIVFGSIAMHMVQDRLMQGYTLYGKAKVGSILGKVGFIVGIVSTVLLTVLIILEVVFFSLLFSTIVERAQYWY